MSTVIYINYDKIKVVTKQNEQYLCNTFPLKEGTVLNGVIVDTVEIISKLEEIAPTLTKTTLIIDSNNVLLKKITVPKLPKDKIKQVIQREFDLGKSVEYYYDYRALNKKDKEETLLGLAVPKEFLDKYIQIFISAGIKLDRIDVVGNVVIKHVHAVRTLKNESFLLNLVSRDALTSLLFENGEFLLLNRSRLHYQIDSEEYIPYFYEKLSTMVQFSKSNKTGYDLDYCYYIGFDQGTVSSLKEEISSRGLDIVIDGRNDDMDYFYPKIGFLQNKEDINLLKAAFVKKENKDYFKLLIPGLPVILLALLFLVFGYFSLKENALDNHIASNEQAIESCESSQQLIDFAEKQILNNEVLLKINEYNDAIQSIEKYKLLDPEFLELIYSDLTITSVKYESTTALLTIAGTSSSKEAISDYSSKLRSAGYTSYQYYNGYQLLVKDGQYSFTIQVSWDLTESEGANDVDTN